MLEDASGSALNNDVARTDGPETSMSSPSLQEDLKLSSTAMRRNRCKPVDSGLPLAGGRARMAEYKESQRDLVKLQSKGAFVYTSAAPSE